MISWDFLWFHLLHCFKSCLQERAKDKAPLVRASNEFFHKSARCQYLSLACAYVMLEIDNYHFRRRKLIVTQRTLLHLGYPF
jgi:hypothetical protein